MQKYTNNVQTINGRAIEGASITVTNLGGGLATIYSDNGVTTQPNPLYTDGLGRFSFYAADGRYTLNILANGQISTITDILLEDPQDGSSAVFSNLTADSVATDTIILNSVDLAGGSGASAIGFLQAGTGATVRTVQSKLREFVSVKDFGAVGDGVTDDTAAIELALTAAGQVYFPSGTYMTTGITLPASLKSIVGESGNRPTIMLINNSNNHVIFGSALSNVEFHNIQVDGNKSNQSIGTGNNWRGIYLLGDSTRIRVDNVVIRDTVDHGLMFSDGGSTANSPGEYSLITNLRVYGCGSASHIAAGGAGGTGCNGGSSTTMWVGCFGYDNYLNGFKGRGTFIGCYSENNGSGFETGFSTPEYTQVKFIGCHARNNGGDGWRNQGQIDEITFIGCLSEGNNQAGMSFINGVNKATIQGCWLKNNGQDTVTAYSDTVGFAGIFVDGTSLAPTDILITGCQFLDDQGTKTQRHHIYIGQAGASVKVGDDNVFGAVLTQPMFVAAVANGGQINIGAGTGLSTSLRDLSAASVTGTTSTTVLKTLTIPANSIGAYNSLRVVAKGGVSGTNGTKVIRLVVGGTGAVIASQAAGEQQDWIVEADIYRISGTEVTVAIKSYEVGGTSALTTISVNSSMSSALTIETNCTLGNALDTVTQELFVVEAK